MKLQFFALWALIVTAVSSKYPVEKRDNLEIRNQPNVPNAPNVPNGTNIPNLLTPSSDPAHGNAPNAPNSPNGSGQPGRLGQPGQPGQPGQAGQAGQLHRSDAGGSNFSPPSLARPALHPDHRGNTCPHNNQHTIPFFHQSHTPWRSNMFGHVFQRRTSGTMPLYSLVNYKTWDVLYTQYPGERNQAMDHWGYESKGIVGHVFKDSRCGGKPLFRLYSKRWRQHAYTTSQQEKLEAMEKGYHNEGVAGYILT